MPKNDKKKSLKSYTRNPALMIGLAIMLPLVGYLGYQKYLDWQNRQLIEGMAEDFPALISGVEDSVDYPLEISSECLQTQEKFSEGVSLCGITVGLTNEASKEINFSNLDSYLGSQELGFDKGEVFANGEGYIYLYKGKKACQFANKRNLYLDCAFIIRESNKRLASELFNEELLNHKKNEALNR